MLHVEVLGVFEYGSQFVLRTSSSCSVACIPGNFAFFSLVVCFANGTFNGITRVTVRDISLTAL